MERSKTLVERSKTLKAVGVVVLLIFVTMSMISGCGTAGNPSTVSSVSSTVSSSQTSKEELPPVELTWYYGVGSMNDVKDLQTVNDEINKVTKEKINATVKLVPYEFGTYEDKLKLIIMSNQDYDLCFTSSWNNKYLPNVGLGAYAALDEAIAKYGKTMTSTIPSKYWQGIKVNGKTYAMLNYQNYVNQFCWVAKKDLVEKYNFNYSSVKKVQDLEPFLENVAKNEKGIYPVFFSYIPVFDKDNGGLLEGMVNNAFPVWTNGADKDLKLFNIYESKGLRSILDMTRDWYNKGYIRKDAVIADKNREADLKAGKYAVTVSGMSPGMEATWKNTYGYDVVAFTYSDPICTTGNIQSTLTAVSANSKNIDRSVMLYDLMYSDKELFNLLVYGIKDKHYTMPTNNSIEYKPDSGYKPDNAWVVGNKYNAYLAPGITAESMQQEIKMVEDGKTSALFGFSFDSSQVKTEVSNLTAIGDQYWYSLIFGSADLDKVLPEVNSKFKAAGLDKVLSEAQKQVDAWKKTK